MQQDLHKQLESIASETKEKIDEVTSRIFDEFDWLTKDHEKIVTALETIQNKLREKRDEYRNAIEQETQDWPKREELEEKITLLEQKLKQVALLLKKEMKK
jgi:acyl-CoA reductase-like NAD-dependent aldehyde dehydrogenase